MDGLLTAATENFIFTLIAVCIVVATVSSAITTIVTTHARERSRREIAAYIASGSMTPEQGERLMRSRVSRGNSCED